MKTINEITADIIDSAIQIHRQFGSGMYEKAYELLLQIELSARGHSVVRERSVDVEYRGVMVHGAFSIDLLVDKSSGCRVEVLRKEPPRFRETIEDLSRHVRTPRRPFDQFRPSCS